MDVLKGFEELANTIEASLQWGNGDTVRSIRALLASTRASMTQRLRDEYEAGWEGHWLTKDKSVAYLDIAKKKAARRNP